MGLDNKNDFDNIKSTHSSVNWARDARCYDINTTFNNPILISKYLVILR
jgi:hypothetical protein